MKRITFIALGAAIVLTGCTGGNSQPEPSNSSSSTSAAPPPPPAVSFTAPVGDAVDFKQPVTITAVNGTLENATLTDVQNIPVNGILSADKTVWTSNEPLAASMNYTWNAQGDNAQKKEASQEGKFNTATATDAEQMRVRSNLGDGQTVGVAAPIILTFDGKVAPEMRANVEKRLKVTTSSPIEGSWAWLPDDGKKSRVHYRPANYWAANTPVHVDIPVAGLPYGNGEYGKTNMTLDFTIGRNQVVTADAQTHRMIITRDGQEVANYPASLGGPGKDRESFNGIHVVTEKHVDKVMTSDRFGYSTPVKYAVRLNNNGEFIHAAPWSVKSQGKANVSHGCVNVSMENAKAYFDTALYGDPVIIQGTSQNLSSRGGDIWDWTVSYDEWKKMSALS